MFRLAALACVVASLCALCACSGCTPPTSPAPLLPGDSGPCTTVLATRLADGGVTTALAPCDFEGN